MRGTDNFMAIRFLRLLTMPWKKTAAFKEGVVDEKGQRIKDDLDTSAEKEAYTMFHRLAFNIKRLFEKAPGSITRNIASYGTALFLLKEELEMSEESLQPLFEYLKMDQVEFNEEIIHLAKMGDIVGECGGVMILKENYEELCEDVGMTSGNTVSSTNVDKHITGRTFKVPNNVFRRFQFGRNKYERWSKYLEDGQADLKGYAQKNPSHTIMLQCEETGAMRAIRRKASNKL